LVSTATLIHPTSSEIRQLSWKSTVAQTSFSELQDDIDMTRNEIDNAVPDPNDPTVGYIKESNPSQENSGRMTTAEFRKLHHIRIKNEGEGNEYAPFESFDCTPFPSQLKRLLLKQGYTAPTPTQAQSWPIVLAKRDIISIARTGSGKTCGFLMPAFHSLLENIVSEPPQKKKKRRQWSKFSTGKLPKVLVVAPTRELAVQIEEESSKFSRNLNNVDTVAVYGGVSKGPQIQTLRRGVDIVVGTPGRCNDLIAMGAFDPSSIDYLVLDEADRMLDMGFEPQIREIVESLTNPSVQTLFFTATWPREVQEMADTFLKDAVQLKIGETDGLQANKAIKQNILVMKEHDKLENMFETLDNIRDEHGDARSMPKVLVFTSRKMQCEDIVHALLEEGYQADALHGDKSQQARSRTMDRFRQGKLKVLVATDVAARGLDVKDISTVINFDFPVGSDGVENYVHRIGRTARGDATGTAFTFVTIADRDRVNELIEVLKSCDQDVPDELEALRPKRPPRVTRNSRYSSPRQGGNQYNSGWGRKGNGSYGGSYRGGRDGDRGDWRDSYSRNNYRDRRSRYDYGDRGDHFERRDRRRYSGNDDYHGQRW